MRAKGPAAIYTYSTHRVISDSYDVLARLRLRGVILITSFGGDGSGCFRGLPGLPPVRVRPCCLAILSWAALYSDGVVVAQAQRAITTRAATRVWWLAPTRGTDLSPTG